jgi:AhpD family alkylhydroperoxidase
MISTHQRRWYQFSLRTMLVVMSIVCVILARVAYLSKCAAFHEHEAAKCGVNPEAIHRSISTDDFVKWVNFQEHCVLAERYRYSMLRPWTLVDTTSPYWHDVKEPRSGVLRSKP